jgi:hypothetical protein
VFVSEAVETDWFPALDTQQQKQLFTTAMILRRDAVFTISCAVKAQNRMVGSS